MNTSQNQSQVDLSVKELFYQQGKIDLLRHYRGQKRQNQPLIGEVLRFWIVVLFWVVAVFGAGVAVAAVTLFLTPLILKPLGVPPEVLNFAAATAPLAVVLTVVPVNAMFLVLLERKFLALLTTRLGPNRVGFNGLLQTFADALKLLFKEDIVPAASDKILFFLSPALFFAPSVIAFLPILAVVGGGLGPFAKTDFSVSLIFVLAVSSLAVMGLIMAGWASNNKYSLIGGLRSAAQAISYEIPLVLSVVAFVVLSGSMSLFQISEGQSKGLLDWNILAGGALLNPTNYQSFLSVLFLGLQVVLFFLLAGMIYFCSLAEVNRIPFDLPEAESELVSGYNTEFTGMKFALFFLAEYTNLFITSLLLSILFFGGTYIGIPALDNFFREAFKSITLLGATLNLSWLFGSFVLLVKAYLFVALAIWVRATLPRFRSDQLMGLAWKVLIPISLFFVLLAALCKTFVGWAPGIL